MWRMAGKTEALFDCHAILRRWILISFYMAFASSAPVMGQWGVQLSSPDFTPRRLPAVSHNDSASAFGRPWDGWYHVETMWGPPPPAPMSQRQPFLFAGAVTQDQQDTDATEGERSRSNSSQSNDDTSGTTQGRDRPLGEEPPDTSEAFLRSASVLLEPGHIQIDYGLEYIHFEARDLIGTDTDVALERVRIRQWFVPFAVRYGWSEKVQVFANLPVGASLLEATTRSGGDTTSVVGLGDVQCGLLKLVNEQNECSPDVIVGCSFTAPTGADAFHPGQVAYLGGGFWNVETHLTLIKSVDPAVLIGNLGYVHYFQADHLGQPIQLGERFIYDFGAGFSINETITFSSIVQGALQLPTEVDDVPVPSSSVEPISLRCALTNYVSKAKIMEPFVRIGLTEDAPQAELGIVTTISN